MEEGNWRNDPGLKSKVVYNKKFAFLPKICQDGSRVWLKYYYKRSIFWGIRDFGNVNNLDTYNLHEDIMENISEEEFVIIRLTEGI